MIVSRLALPATPATARPGNAPIDYFALGDSVASGHGLMDDGSSCRRSSLSYPFKVMGTLRAQNTVMLHFLACSGAPASQLSGQVDQVIAAATSARHTLVSITIGADDYGWADVNTFNTWLYQEQERTYVYWMYTIAAHVKASLESQLRRLIEQTNAVIVLTEYYQPFNQNSVFFFPPGQCGIQDCYHRLEITIDHLNSTLATVVADIGRPDRLVMTHGLRSAFNEHRSPRATCGSAGPAVSDTWTQYPNDLNSNARPFATMNLSLLVKLRLNDPKNWTGDCIHPNEQGAQAYANAVLKAAQPLLDNTNLALTEAPIQAAPTAIIPAVPTPTLVTNAPRSFYADLGDTSRPSSDPESEQNFALQGWGDAQGAPENPFQASNGDTTKRYQTIGGDNSLTFAPVVPGVTYVLTVEFEDGSCLDSFLLFINGDAGHPLLDYPGTADQGTPIKRQLTIPGDRITSTQLTVTFRNKGDSCGRAGVYYVQLDPVTASNSANFDLQEVTPPPTTPPTQVTQGSTQNPIVNPTMEPTNPATQAPAVTLDLDVQRWCQTYYQDPNATAAALNMSDPNSWVCQTNGQQQPVNMNDVAVLEYGQGYCAYVVGSSAYDWKAGPCQ